METLLQPLLASPRLPQYIRELTDAYADEQARREKFITDLRDDQKAEFINGVTVLSSPARLRHSLAVEYLSSILRLHADFHQLGVVVTEKTLIRLTRNDYEPDIAFFGPEKAAALDLDQMIFPAPDLAVEVLSKSTAHRDRGVKFADYAAHGVTEYWIVDARSRTLEIWRLGASGTYASAATLTGDDILQPMFLPGLQIPLPAIFEREANLRAIRALLSP